MKVIFENATIADSIAKANKVAPTRGEAFDKASGIVMIFNEEDQSVSIRATNLIVYYLEVVDAIEVKGSATWRFHAGTLSAVAGKLPIGSGKTVSFEFKDGHVVMKSGRITAKFRLNNPEHFPTWEPYDVDLLEMVPDLGSRIQQVEWAAVTDNEADLAGIRLDGESVMATDRFRLAMAPCEAEPIVDPITIPAGILKPLISSLRDIAIGVEGGTFLMMPDASTQIKTATLGKDFPNIKPIIDRVPPASVKFNKSSFLDMVDRATVFAQNDRSSRMSMIVGRGEVAVMCSDVDTGLLGDVIDIPGQADHSRATLLFTPKNLTQAIAASPSEEVIFQYDPDMPAKPVRIDGGSGYVAVVMPRKEMGGD